MPVCVTIAGVAAQLDIAPRLLRGNEGRRRKMILQMGMPQLDPSIFERPKAGFVLPIEVWAKDKLAGDIEQVFADRALVESVGLRPAALDRLWRAFRAGAPGIYGSRIWAPYVLLRWCREHSITLG